jgi:hypothetical protein
MRRFLLSVFASCAAGAAAPYAAGAAAFSLWPRQIGGYLALFGQHTVVNRGVAVTVPVVLTVLLLALRVRLWRSERDLARARRGLPADPAGPPYGAAYPAPWGARPAR